MPQREDAAAIAAALNEHSRALTGRDDVTVDDVAYWFAEPGLDPERDMRVAAAADGTIAGYADLGGEVIGPVWIDVRLRPGREHIGLALLEEMERCAVRCDAPPRPLRAAIHGDDARAREVLERAGYVFLRSGYRMELDLADVPPAVAWPDGLSAHALERDEVPRAFDAYTKAFAGSPDFYPLAYEQWAFWLFDEDENPAFGFAVEDGDELAGLSILRERRGGDLELGWIHVIGVRPQWRRRGLGRALLRHALHELRARGKPRVGLGVDGANDSAVRLYETEGMRIARRNDVYEKAS